MMLRDFRALIVLADELHFGRAAERLGMVQPQLSEVIRRIERQAGVVAFTRRPRVTVTAGGAILIEVARKLVRDADLGLERAKAVALGKAGLLRVGIAPVAMCTTVPETLQRFLLENPDVRLQLTEAASGRLWEQLVQGQLDLIVSRQAFEAGDASSSRVFGDRIELVLPKGHRLEHGEPLALADLASESFVFFARSSGPRYYDRIVGACQRAGLTLRVAQEAESWNATWALVRAGFGISFGTASLRHVEFPGVVFREIADRMPDASFWVTFHPDRAPPAAHLLVAALRALDGGSTPEGGLGS